MLKVGPTNTIIDVPNLSIGNAHDDDIRTGSTVLVLDQPSRASVIIPGGGPGTRETALLQSGRLVDKIDALVLSGGSAFGLAAVDGVLDALHDLGRGYELLPNPNVPATPIVPAAILYDLANGGNKKWGNKSPYYTLGRKAFENASKDSPKLGRSGAGYGAKAGGTSGGLGSASISKEDFTIGALVAVNSFGSVRIPNQSAFWSAPYEIDSEFGGKLPNYEKALKAGDWGDAKVNPVAGENTTLAIIATNAPLGKSDLDRILQMAVTGMARAIRPVFTPFDGDIIFAVSTADKESELLHPLKIAELGELAAQTLARAIARGVYEAEIQDGQQA